MAKRFLYALLFVATIMLVSDVNYAEAAKQRLLIGTSTVGGSSYVLGGAWGKMISEQLPDVDISVEVTGGADSNIVLVQNKEMELGWATTWQAGIRYNGEGPDKKKMQDIRSFAPMYASYLQIYCLADKPIYRLNDLAGKNVASASAGSGSDLGCRTVLDALNIKIAKQNRLSTGAIADSLRDGLSDAAFTLTGLPGPFMLELESTREVRLLPISDEEMAAILKAVPYWRAGIVPKGMYKCVKEDQKVISLWNMGIVHKDIDEELVYRITKATIENMKAVGETVHGVSTTTPKDLDVCTVPLHKGALRYYKEIGIDVPAELIPAEAK